MKQEVKRFFKKIVINTLFKILTLLVWIIFLLALLWILSILAWLIFDILGYDFVFIPSDSETSTILLFILLVWSVVVSILFYNFSKRNKAKHKNQSALLYEHPQSYSWTEIEFIPSEAKSNHLLKQKLLSQEELINLPSPKMLSYGINLYYQGRVSEAIGILRLVIERPDSTPLLVKTAEYRLYQILPYLSTECSEIINKREEGRNICS